MCLDLLDDPQLSDYSAALASDAEIIKAVATTPGGIGYIDAASLNDSVKAVYRVK